MWIIYPYIKKWKNQLLEKVLVKCINYKRRQKTYANIKNLYIKHFFKQGDPQRMRLHRQPKHPQM